MAFRKNGLSIPPSSQGSGGMAVYMTAEDNLAAVVNNNYWVDQGGSDPTDAQVENNRALDDLRGFVERQEMVQGNVRSGVFIALNTTNETALRVMNFNRTTGVLSLSTTATKVIPR